MADLDPGCASAIADDKAPCDRTPRIADRYVRLDRSTDRERPCCENLATLRPGKGPHGAELRCAGCGRHRRWLPEQDEFIFATVFSAIPIQSFSVIKP